MRNWSKLFTVVAALALVTHVACGDENDDETQGPGGGGGTGGGAGGTGGTGGEGGGTGGEWAECDGASGEETVTGNITGNVTWCAGTAYTLEDTVVVKSGATLRIQPGTVIEGNYGSSLLVTRGARIEALGEKDAPIVFTASDPDDDGKLPGDWGGIILLGNAPTNIDGGVGSIEGFPAGSTSDIEYGGNDADDSSGTMRYVRIEFAGYEFAADEEINGLTLGGVGRGTTLEYIQVHAGADDGLEFFGGTVDAKWVVVTRPDDDGIDWDLGWTGRIQYAVVQQESAVGNCGYEADNDGSSPNKDPRSNPTIFNVTMVGSDAAPGTAGKKQLGMCLKEGTGGTLRNHIVAHFADFAIDVVDEPTAAIYGEALTFADGIVFDNDAGDDFVNPNIDKDAEDGGFDEAAEIGDSESVRNVDPMLEAPLDLTAPSFMPKTGSPALTGGAAAPDDGFFDTDATFVGAFGTENWMDGWTAFPEPAELE